MKIWHLRLVLLENVNIIDLRGPNNHFPSTINNNSRVYWTLFPLCFLVNWKEQHKLINNLMFFIKLKIQSCNSTVKALCFPKSIIHLLLCSSCTETESTVRCLVLSRSFLRPASSMNVCLSELSSMYLTPVVFKRARRCVIWWK